MSALFSGLRSRGRFAPGLLAGLVALGFSLPVQAVELPQDPDTLVATIEEAINAKDYDRFEELVFWKDAGKIKKRIVAFQIRRGLGRPIKSITFEEFPEGGLAGAEDTGKLVVNMPVTNRVRVVYDEEPINDTGKLPTSVFLVGKLDDAYRIGLVVRRPDFEDDDDD